MSSEIAIKIESLSKCYEIYDQPRDRLKQLVLPRMQQLIGRSQNHYCREFWALKDVSFDVKKGETVGIVGRNGCGKSTLLQIITGTLAPTTGTVETHGRISALLELGAGFNPEFTGRENVYLSASILGMTKSAVDERFDQIAAFADIGRFMDSPVKHYSSGMFARLAFSAAVHVDPEILIVDEILAVGDLAFQRKCLNKFYQIRDGGCSILFVSHDPYQVKSICQRALYLDGGLQRMFGPAYSVIDEYAIEMEGLSSGVTLQNEYTGDEFVEISNEQISETYAVQPGPSEGGVESSLREVGESPKATGSEPDQLYRITDVVFTDGQGMPVEVVVTGQLVCLEFDFISLTTPPPDQISFVFNLYRHDDLYICGSTTLMDGLAAHEGCSTGRVKIEFPDFPMLNGQYKWRVAINDHFGFVTHAEATGVCQFRVQDNFKAVGMFNLSRQWHFNLSQN